MALKDAFGLTYSGATDAGFSSFARAVHELQCFIGDPVGSVDRAIADDPGFVMAHVFKGYLFALATEREATAVARACHEAALPLAATAREQGHVAALGHLAAGRWHDAAHLLEDIAIDSPLDALALQVGHQIDFFTGNARMLRDRIGRALPAWQKSMPGYHAILGMQAFGLEEMGDYARAESFGRQAIAIEARDGWAQHAVAHVMEMQSRQRDGIAWMRANPEAWTRDSFLKIHNWWHLALFHYDLGEMDEVLKLYDGPIYGDRSTLALNMVDASAVLWRLHLGGIYVGERWAALAAHRNRAPDQADPVDCPPFWRQPCAARRDRPDADRSRAPRRRQRAGAGVDRRAPAGAAGQPAVGAVLATRCRFVRELTRGGSWHKNWPCQIFSRSEKINGSGRKSCISASTWAPRASRRC
nr:tetratricopeptide repeat protein [Mesorhizobium sp.]